MSTVYFNVVGGPTAGGPGIFVYKCANALSKLGHRVVYDKPNRADVALCIIETGRVLKQINRQKTKTILRLDGIYCKKYWHGGEGRAWRSDMTALHNKLLTDINAVDFMVYQSQWSKDRADQEIIKRKDDNWAIIGNGVDVGAFKPHERKKDGFINLIHVGKIRNDYIMLSLIETYKELQKRGYKVRLVLVGNMDSECSKIYHEHKKDNNIVYMGAVPNNKLSAAYSFGDIGLYVRMGSSCDNVIAETMSCKIPVVIPQWGGNIEQIEHDVSGVAVDGGQWGYDEKYIQNLSDGVEKIIKNLEEFKINARKHAVEKLNIDLMIQKYLKVMGI